MKYVPKWFRETLAGSRHVILANTGYDIEVTPDLVENAYRAYKRILRASEPAHDWESKQGYYQTTAREAMSDEIQLLDRSHLILFNEHSDTDPDESAYVRAKHPIDRRLKKRYLIARAA